MKNNNLLKAFILIIIIVFSSCEEPEEDRAYYKFTDEDYEVIPNYKEGQTLVFKNQDGDEMKFTVSIDSEKKLLEDIWAIFGPSYFYYYDYLAIYLETYQDIYIGDSLLFENERFPSPFYFWRLPINREEAKSNYSIEFPSEFNASFNFAFWNIAGEIQLTTNFSEIIFMELENGTSFNNVKVFRSYSDLPWEPYNYERKTNTIYFVDKIGIIGFDEIDGNKWRLY